MRWNFRPLVLVVKDFHVRRFMVRSLNSSGRQCRDRGAIVGAILPVSFKVSREKEKKEKKGGVLV